MFTDRLERTSGVERVLGVGSAAAVLEPGGLALERQYDAVIKGPMIAMTKDFSDEPFMALLARDAEIRALIGGTTAIQGASGDC
jgi:hypothetical protein